MFSLILGNWKIFAWLAVAAACLFAIHKYNESVRAPLVREIKFLTDSIEANKKQAQALLDQREKENAALAEKWRQYSRKSDDDYEAKIASLRAAGSSGLRIHTGCGNGSGLAGSSKTASAGTPETTAPESRTGNAAPEVVFGLAEIGQVLQWYAYGQSCHAFANGK